MKLWRVIFLDKTSSEYYNHWHTSEQSAEVDAQKLIKDGVTDKTAVDYQEMFNQDGKRDRVTIPVTVDFLNRHALVNIDMSDRDMDIENDSMGG